MNEDIKFSSDDNVDDTINAGANAGADENIEDIINNAEDVPDPLDGLTERTMIDPGAPFMPEALEALTALRRDDRAAFETLRAQLKKAGCRVTVLEEALGRLPRSVKHRPSGEPEWRECTMDGGPSPSMHNARLAITAIGVECSYDTFHNKVLFGYQDDTTRHVVQSILGEVNDDGLLGLRQLLSDRFGFDLTERHVRDAVKSLALDHCFDPVADMLAEAEAKWDKVVRLDRVAADYFNCEDTKLNNACFRKTMIAGVARVRQPGCKFDNILVLEAPEGWNKSTALRVLAMDDENFSDESIIGKESREVQEQLSTIWIHENAELAGMKKAEIETVKAFARRQVDRARPAYGHFHKKQPRHSIETATTNSEEYQLSQTGNRTFWGMKVRGMIDLEKLTADRLQLWGEAAHYQSMGESLVIDEALWPDAGAEQEKRRVKDPWETVLENMPWSVNTRDYDEGVSQYITETHQIIHYENEVATRTRLERVSSHSLLTYVLKIRVGDQETRHAMRLSTVMKLLGWDRDGNKVTIDGKQVRGYFRRVKI